MAKGKSTWKYNKLLTARRNYYDGGGFLGMDWSNPFKGANGTQAKGALLSAAGSAVGNIGGGLIGGGMTSGVGNVLGGLSSVASAIPGPWGAVASAGLGLMSGLTNRMFGSKMNEENIAKVESNINNLNSFQSNASDFDTLSQNWANADVGMTFSDSFIGKDGWFSNKAKNKAADLRRQIDAGNAWVQNTLTNNAENIGTTQMQNLLSNYAAFGGPLLYSKGGSIHIKPENRGKFTETKRRTGKTTEELTHSSNPLTRKRAIFAQNAKKWHHAFGGELNTQGGDFTNGLLYIDNGGSHESNPYEGVPLGVDPEGTPNLVEEGETIFNDYVFSNRLIVPKKLREKYKLGKDKRLTFAEASKKLAKESEERPNDPISMRGLEAMLSELANAQEAIKFEKAQKNLYAEGGLINKFSGNEPHTSKMVRKSNYQRNKKYNGNYDRATIWGELVATQILSRMKDIASMPEGAEKEDAINNFINEYNNIQDSYYSDIYNSGAEWAGPAIEGVGGEHQNLWNTAGYNNYNKDVFNTFYSPRENSKDIEPNWVDNTIGDITLNRNGGIDELIPEEYRKLIEEEANNLRLDWRRTSEDNPLMRFNRRIVPVDSNTSNLGVVPDMDKPDKPIPVRVVHKKTKEEEEEDNNKYYDNLRFAPAVGYGIAALTDSLGLTNKADYSNAESILEASNNAGAYSPVKFQPIGNYLTYKPLDRDYYLNKMNAEAGATRRNLLNTSGGNRGAAMAGILAADNNYLNQVGNLARQAEEYNLAQRQQIEDFNRNTNIINSQGFLQADMANQKALMESKDMGLKGIMTAAQMKEAIRQSTDNNKSSNISGLFQTLGDIGFEERNRRMVGWGHKKSLWGPGTKDYVWRKNGGKIKRKRGLTY